MSDTAVAALSALAWVLGILALRAALTSDARRSARSKGRHR
ncbi:hypothetical protein ACGFZH_21035 [Streptomyces zaomyceticus]